MITVHSDLSKIERMFSNENMLNAQEKLAHSIVEDTDKYVPSSGKDGSDTLRKNVSIAHGGSSITYNAKYAYFQYYQKLNFKPMRERTRGQQRWWFAHLHAGLVRPKTDKAIKYTTAGTGPVWFGFSKNANMGKWTENMKKDITNGQ